MFLYSFPLTVAILENEVTVRGFCGSLSWTTRRSEVNLVSPEGSRTLKLELTGACIPNRGSGPRFWVETVPSAKVVVVTPEGDLAETVRVPSGARVRVVSVPMPS
jgi:hypothetical protein